MEPNRKISIFISYSHLDENEKEQFVKFLNPIDIIELDIWVDDWIEAGAEFDPEISSAIENADIALLLISPDFLNSKFIKTKELPRILERQSEKALRVFPLIIKSCSWQNVKWISKRNVKPKNGKPIFEQTNVNQELDKIVDEIVVVAKDILRNQRFIQVNLSFLTDRPAA
jgi:predicted transcriptional regulator